MILTKRINLQIASDDLSSIAEAVDDVIKMLDKFHAAHGTELYERVEKAWPLAYDLVSKPLHDLARQLEPPE